MEAFMKTILKYAAAATMVGALALAAATPSEARGGRNAAAAIGFGAGALIGAAVVGSAYNNGYYGPGYGYAPGYAYGPGYGYDADYAYEPVYAPTPRYQYRYRGGSNCIQSPGSSNFGACN
jgi:hypothetical protein